MGIADELRKLEELHRAGGLSDEEFARAKAAILNAPPSQAAPAVREPPTTASIEQQTRQWALFIHLGQLAGLAVPLAGIVLPIVLWQVKKNELPGLDVHGKIVFNWIITELIYLIGCVVLAFCLIGIPLLIALVIVGIVFPILGAIKANNGEAWEYPLSIRWLS